MKTETTKVIFRQFNDGDVIAIFPEINWLNNQCNYGKTMSYMHFGQHGECDYQYLLTQTYLADEADYKDLFKELESLGYKLKVMKRYYKEK